MKRELLRFSVLVLLVAVNTGLFYENHQLLRQTRQNEEMLMQAHASEFMAGVSCGMKATWVEISEAQKTHREGRMSIYDLDFTNLITGAVAYRTRDYPNLPSIDLPKYQVVVTNLPPIKVEGTK